MGEAQRVAGRLGSGWLLEVARPKVSESPGRFDPVGLREEASGGDWASRMPVRNYTFKNNGSLLALLRTFNTYGNFPLHKRL